MKKSKLTLSIVTSLMATLALAGCNEAVTKGKDGYILTLTNSSGTKVNVTADEIFGDYYTDVSGVKKMFDSVYELYVRNYWKDENLKSDLKDIEKTAKAKVQADKDTAKSNVTTGTTYDDALKEILDEKGVDSVKELYSYYEYQLMKDKYEEDFYDDNLLALRDGFNFGTQKDGYLKEKIPYHVKHILVNVAASSGALYNGEITEENARKLASVAKIIAESTGTEQSAYTFGQLALEQSDDSVSRANYGDLGIMDKDTSFVNEFKLGIYAYDSIYNKNTVANKDLIGIPEEEANFFTNDEDAQIGQIPYAVFEELERVANVTKSGDFVVNDGKAFFYPRNIYFNKYLNNHRISVIVPNNLPVASELYQADPTTGKATGTEAYVGTRNTQYAQLPGFKAKGSELQNIDWINNDDGRVLCDEEGKVILVVRAGTSSYQGVHFIVVERSALQETVTKIVAGQEEEISLSNYYTPYYPAQNQGKLYPHYSDGSDMDTYVNKFVTDKKGDKERAEEVKSKITGYESNISTYIYESLATSQSLVFHGEEGAKLEAAIKNYIKSVRESTANSNELSWEQTWQGYMEYIENQTAQRGKDKLLSATCAIGFEGDHSGKAWSKGGMCGYDNGQ